MAHAALVEIKMSSPLTSNPSRKRKPPLPPSAASTPRSPLNYVLAEPGTSLPLPSGIGAKLDALARRHFAFALWRLGLLLALGTASVIFTQALLDYFLDLPLAVRAIFLFLDVAVLVGFVALNANRIRKGKLTREQTALMVQRKWPTLKGSLIAAVQFTGGSGQVPNRSAKLVEQLLTQVAPQVEKLRFQEVFPARANWRLTALALLVWWALGLIAFLAMPVSLLLFERLFLSNQAFPAQTRVIAGSQDITVGLGDNVQLEARAAGRIPSRAIVEIFHSDGTKEELPVASQADRAELFSTNIHNIQNPFQYRFKINDAIGEKYTVKTRITPLLEKLDCAATYPAYTGLGSKQLVPNQISVIAGTVLQLRVTASTDLSQATLVYQGWTGSVPMKLDAKDAKVATLTLPVMNSDLTGFSIALKDKAGVSSVNDTIYHVESISDEPPTVRIAQPTEESLTVTLHSKLQIVIEVSDNYGLSKLSLHYEITPATTGDQEPQPVELKPIDIDLKQTPFTPNVVATVTVPISVADQTPPWHEGDSIRYWIEATDNNNVTGPGVTVSNSQQLIVVTPEAKRDEILQRLQDSANSMQDVLQDQSEINDEIKTATPAPK
jgi:hypothetical protein